MSSMTEGAREATEARGVKVGETRIWSSKFRIPKLRLPH